jgi:uncharacterized protein (TIRG00374 family)
MNLTKLTVIGLALIIVTIAVFSFLTNPFPVISEAESELVLLSLALYVLSLLVWNLVYLFLLYKLQENLKRAKAFSISILSLIGFLTPANIGTDVLRAILNKRMIHLSYEETLAACIQTRKFKLRVTLLLAIPLLPFLSTLPRNALFLLLTSMFLILLFLLSLSYVSRERAKKMLSRLGVGELGTYTRKIMSKLTLKENVLIYSSFIVGFIMEVLSLRACFLSLSLQISVFNFLALFAILYFLSRLPFLPQGVILVEAVGFIVLVGLNFTAQQTGAVLVLWDFVRLVAPIAIAIGCSLTFLKDSMRLKSLKSLAL